MNKYVQNHNYGYGQNNKEINKLNLRNLDDVKSYLQDILDNNVISPYEKLDEQTYKLTQTNLTLKIVES